jgi:choline dehydrogenase
MIYTRGNRNDYDGWAEMGNTGKKFKSHVLVVEFKNRIFFLIEGWSYDEVLKYFMKSENVSVSNAEKDYHGQDGLLSVTDVPYRTPIANAFVNAGSQIGLPVIDVNGKKQVGINYIQVNIILMVIRGEGSNS